MTSPGSGGASHSLPRISIGVIQDSVISFNLVVPRLKEKFEGSLLLRISLAPKTCKHVQRSPELSPLSIQGY